MFIDIITTILGTNMWYIINILDRYLFNYIAINILIIYINKLNTLTLIYDIVIENKKNNNLKIILKVQLFTSEQISDHNVLAPSKNWYPGQL
jgi:hypothetical protein